MTVPSDVLHHIYDESDFNLREKANFGHLSKVQITHRCRCIQQVILIYALCLIGGNDTAEKDLLV